MFYNAVLVSFVVAVISPAQAVEFTLFGNTTQVTADLLFQGNQNDYQALVDRVVLSRSFTGYFNISAGRMHTPIGFWNQNFHHGSYIQDTVQTATVLTQLLILKIRHLLNLRLSTAKTQVKRKLLLCV